MIPWEQLESAISLHQAGKLAEAETIYRQILAQQPNHAEALNLLGALAIQVGRIDAAQELIRRAIRVKPDLAEAYGNLGVALKATGRLAEALAAYRQAIGLNPDLPEAQRNLGNTLAECGQLDEAIVCYRHVIRLRPGDAAAHNRLGLLLESIGRLDEAIASYRQSAQINPGNPQTHRDLGIAFTRAERLDEAIAAYREAIRLKPDYPDALSNLGCALRCTGRLDEAIGCDRKAIGLEPHHAGAHSNLVLTLHYHPGSDPRSIDAELRRWRAQHAEPLRKFIQPHCNDPDPDRRLRIGYVSPDFRDHVVGHNLLPLFRIHDHGTVEVFCYSHVLAPDAFTAQFRSHADVWRDIARLSDSQAVDLIRNDRIDILVDLTVHSANNRLLIFAYKPAPVQATFAGYPGSTGLDTIDYRLTDPHLDSSASTDEFYSETSIRLPDTFWCFEPVAPRLQVGPSPALSDGFITFGCLNNFCKVNEQVLRLWGRVLKAVDRSRMLILCPEGSHRQSLLDLLREGGIDPDRVDLTTRRPHFQYMELYHRIDVGLDTFPYNGHSTSLDSFWMGVPVVTLVGNTVVGRAGLSQLTNLGLPELIAPTPEAFVRIAADLANDLPRLNELRRTLRRRMQASPLTDAPRFGRNIEAAYRQMWRTWCGQRG